MGLEVVAAPSPKPRPQPRQRPRVTVLTSMAELVSAQPLLAALAANLAEPNPFYEPWMLLPALETFGRDRALRMVLVTDNGGEGERAIGFFPLERMAGLARWPLPSLRLFSHPHCFLHVPLVLAGHAEDAVHALFDWLAQEPEGARLLELQGIAGEGPVWHAVAAERYARELPGLVWESYARAVFRPGADVESYLTEALSAKRLAELRRQQRRLAESGPVEVLELGPGDDASAWLGAFLELEAAGWKKDFGAFNTRPAERTFFRTFATAGLTLGRLRMMGLRQAGRFLAMNVNLMAPDGGFAFKTAYDEEFSRFAPGLMVEVENLRRLHARPEIRWLDSCSSPQNVLLNRLFRERRIIQSVVMAPGGALGGLVLAAMPMARMVVHRARKLAVAAGLRRRPQ